MDDVYQLIVCDFGIGTPLTITWIVRNYHSAENLIGYASFIYYNSFIFAAIQLSSSVL